MPYALRNLLFALAASVVLAACGGDGDAKSKACIDEVARKLDGKTYKLDEAALASSQTEEGDGIYALTAPIVIQPGMTNELAQTVRCRVRTVNGKTDVISLNFIW